MPSALQVAIDLLHLPSRVRQIRSGPLPENVLILLRIAAGDEETTREAIALVGRSRENVHKAAAFFIEQILLSPDADSYRVLGATPEATRDELRRNMALLLRWLHPDLDRQGERSIFARRVTRAWEQLKTEERRAAYDQSRPISPSRNSKSRRKHRGRPKPARHLSERYLKSRQLYGGHGHFPGGPGGYTDESAGFLRRALLFLFGRTESSWPRR
jgi:hypothetical protein